MPQLFPGPGLAYPGTVPHMDHPGMSMQPAAMPMPGMQPLGMMPSGMQYRQLAGAGMAHQGMGYMQMGSTSAGLVGQDPWLPMQQPQQMHVGMHASAAQQPAQPSPMQLQLPSQQVMPATPQWQ